MKRKKLRRIITGHNEQGKSIVIHDDHPISFGGLYEMWVTEKSPADNRHKNDAAKRKVKLEPPSNGSLFPFFRILPEDTSKSIEEVEKETALNIRISSLNEINHILQFDMQYHKVFENFAYAANKTNPLKE